MKLNFKKPTILEKVETVQGVFPLNYLTNDEFEEFCQLWYDTISEHRKKQIKNK